MRKNVFLILLIVAIVSTYYLISFINIKPSNDLAWEDEFRVLTSVDVVKGQYTFNDIRDWRWDENGVVSKNYATKTYSINDLENVWFLLQTFDSNKRLAHTFLIFDFKNGDSISLSIEARREKGEKYNGFYGIFKKFELMYTWGTEEDFLVKRAVNMGQDIYMYPLLISDAGKENLFKELVLITNNLYQKPAFYNTLTSNCTSNLAKSANNINKGSVPVHYSWWITGLSDKYLYKLGLIPNKTTFEQTRKQHYVTEAVQQNYKNEDFKIIVKDYLN